MAPARWLYTIPLCLRTLFRRHRVERELDEELRFHLELQIEQNIAAGMEAREARRQAFLALRGVERCKEECRDMRHLNLIEDLARDLAYAARILRNTPAFALAAVLTITLGIAAAAGLTRALTSMLVGVKPADPATFGIMAALSLLVASMACWAPARRAARLDPATSLRQE